MDGISRSRGWDKEIPHGVLPMEQLVLSDKWARKFFHGCPNCSLGTPECVTSSSSKINLLLAKWKRHMVSTANHCGFKNEGMPTKVLKSHLLFILDY